MTAPNSPVPANVYGVAVGTTSTSPFITIIRVGAPTSSDTGFPVTQRWINSQNNEEYFLLNYTSTGGFIQANWVLLNSGGGTLTQLKDNLGNSVFPTAGGAINVVGSGSTGVTTNGTLAANTLTIELGSIPNSSLANSSITVTSTNGSIAVTGSPVSLGGTVNLATSGGGVAWVDVMSGAQLLAANTGYVVDNGAGLVTFTLPAVATIGDTYIIQGKSSGGWQVNVGAGQVINVGNHPTTISTGNVASTNQWDSVTITCVTANTTFATRAVQGNLAIT
jgi:hypothetical protein